MVDATHRIPVAIIGGGPVGLVLALMLDRHGVGSVVFNSEQTTRGHPKGGTQNARTMEHFRRLGIAAEIRKLGLPADHPTDVVYLTRFGGFELARLTMPSAADKLRAVAQAAATDQVPEPLHRANQMYVEKFLLDHARTRPNITLRFGWRADDIDDDGDGVTVRASRAQDGLVETWRASYVAGCDGGQGLVRRHLGIHYEGFKALERDFLGGRMFATYLRSADLARQLPQPRAFQYWLVNPQFRTAVISLNGRDEFMMWTKPPTADAVPDDAAVIDTLRRSTRAAIDVAVIAHSPWTAGVALVAERFAAGRVFLAGDAAHLFTPTGGFGMNTGIEDAANLAWKLAATIQGWGGERLLATYETERKAIAIRNTGAARQLSENVGAIKVPAAIEDASADGDAARSAVGALLATFGEQYASLGVQLGARYDGSPLIVADGAPPADDVARYTPSSIPGGRTPHLWLGDSHGAGHSLYDRLGAGFTVLRLGPRAPDASAIVAAAAQRQLPMQTLDLPGDTARDLYGCDLAIVRPDQHIAWRGNRPPDDADRLLAQLAGAAR